jgi:hypothetical protein
MIMNNVPQETRGDEVKLMIQDIEHFLAELQSNDCPQKRRFEILKYFGDLLQIEGIVLEKLMIEQLKKTIQGILETE